jgi:dTDP-glucose pyrophosphorylase
MQYDCEQLLRNACAPHNLVLHVILEPTQGAACTVLVAESLINNDNPLMIANSDQWMDFNIERFIKKAKKYDGLILTMFANDNKWSYVGRGLDGKVNAVVEKQVISNEATCGLYWYRKGSDFVKSAQMMIAANDRHNGELYVAPVYNYLLKDQGTIETMRIKGMHGMGTPEDLEAFLKSKAIDKATNF